MILRLAQVCLLSDCELLAATALAGAGFLVASRIGAVGSGPFPPARILSPARILPPPKSQVVNHRASKHHCLGRHE